MLTIDNFPKDNPFIEQLIQKKFSEYTRVIIKKEFDAGLSNSQVFMVRTIKSTGAELPSVIKIGPQEIIDKEWRSYTSIIQRCLPGETGIDGQPVFTDDHKYGLLWYPLAGHGAYEVISLLDFLRHAGLENIQQVLLPRLFRNLNTLWRSSRITHQEFSLSSAYDAFLPPHLTIEVDTTLTPKNPYTLHPEQSFDEKSLKVGGWVKVSGFELVETKYDENILVLNPEEDKKPLKLHAFIKQNSDLEQLTQGEKLSKPLIGKIINTRKEMIQEQIKAAFGNTSDISSATIFLPNQKEYPNPLFAWETILNQSFDVYEGPIHGDLNLNNVLIDQDSKSVHLIDFAHSRHGYILQDFYHLEMSLLGTLLTETLWQNQLNSSWVCQFYEGLHQTVTAGTGVDLPKAFERPFIIFQAIREEARHHLFEPDNWSEYYNGLFIHFLGSLKFSNFGDGNLDAQARQALAWGMSVLLSLIEQSSKSRQPKEQLETNQKEGLQHSTFTDNYIEGDGNIIGEGNQINIGQKFEPLERTSRKKSNYERNEVKGNQNIIGRHNQVNKKN